MTYSEAREQIEAHYRDRERHGRTSRGPKHSDAIRAGLRRVA